MRPQRRRQSKRQGQLNRMRDKLQRELGIRGISFKYTGNIETAVRAAVNAVRRAGKSVSHEKAVNYLRGAPATIPIRGKSFLLYLPTEVESYKIAHEMGHAGYNKVARMRGRSLPEEIKSSLSFSFQMEYMDPEQIARFFRTEFYHKHSIQGQKLAKAIRELASNDPQLRAQIRKEIIELEFKTVNKAIAYLKEKYH